MTEKKLTRVEFTAFIALVESATATYEYELGVEILVVESDGSEDYEEIFDFPGEVSNDPDWDGIDPDLEALEAFPGLHAELLSRFETDAQMAEEDRYTRRAEQGWCNY